MPFLKKYISLKKLFRILSSLILSCRYSVQFFLKLPNWIIPNLASKVISIDNLIIIWNHPFLYRYFLLYDSWKIRIYLDFRCRYILCKKYWILSSDWTTHCFCRHNIIYFFLNCLTFSAVLHQFLNYLSYILLKRYLWIGLLLGIFIFPVFFLIRLYKPGSMHWIKKQKVNKATIICTNRVFFLSIHWIHTF